LDEKGILFISRLPDTFGISDELKERAWSENPWQEAGQIAQTHGSATYRIQEFPGDIEGMPYRFIVVGSSSLDKRKEKSLAGQIEKEEQTLTKAMTELAKITYACRPDAENAIQLWLAKQKPKYHKLDIVITEERVTEKRGHRGRPRGDEPPVTETVYRTLSAKGAKYEL